MEPAGPREAIGLVFRGLHAELDRRGLLDRVLARLQGDAREVLERPPLHGSWRPAALHDQIILAIAVEAGRQAVRDVAYEVARGTTGPVSRPLLRIFLNLFGASPLSLLNNLNRISALQMRGIHFLYTPETEKSGVVTITHCEPVDPIQFVVWEGVFTFGKDIFGYPVHVEPSVPHPGGRSGTIRVAW